MTETGQTGLRVVPANQATWEDLRAVFGEHGAAYRCQCQRFKLPPGEAFAHHPPEVRAERLRSQTCAGRPAAARTTGLVAHLDGEPVGWCAVEPRCDLDGLLRNQRVPWDGRSEDREDPTVWAVTCVFARAGFRRRGIGSALVVASVEHARRQGARALEGYPMTTNLAIDEELGVGLLCSFLDAGFVEVGRPTKRRAVVRIDF